MRDRRLLATILATLVALAGLCLPTAASAQPTEQLTVTLAGTGTGSVTDSNYDFLCPSNCSYAYAQGAQVELTASAGSGSEFAGWSGAGCSGTSTCIITMSQAEDVTATFNVIPPTPTEALSIDLEGSGTGQVTDSNYDFLCPSDCSDTFNQGATVELTATASTGSTFAGWSGAGCSGTESCIVTMSAAQTVAATFLAPGRGTVTVPRPAGLGHHHGGRAVRARVTLAWRWSRARSVLERIHITRLPHDATITLACRGRRRPFTVRRTDAAGVGGFERGLVGTAFRAGDRLTLTIAARHERTERALIVVRREQKPRARLL